MSSTYETTQGTTPTPHGEHEPRTITRAIEADNFYPDADLHMMSEIGDGVFVAWSECRQCKKRVADCACKGGPVEPPYIKPWRDDRFKRDLNTRPDPSYKILDSVIDWVRERGYTVVEPEPEPEPEPVLEEFPGESNDQDIAFVEDEGLQEDRRIIDRHDPDYQLTEEVDRGLDAALEKVAEARRDIDPGF